MTQRTLAECARRILEGYQEVCKMTPHVDWRQDESTDNAVRLAVHFQFLVNQVENLRRAYNQRDDVAFDSIIKQILGS